MDQDVAADDAVKEVGVRIGVFLKVTCPSPRLFVEGRAFQGRYLRAQTLKAQSSSAPNRTTYRSARRNADGVIPVALWNAVAKLPGRLNPHSSAIDVTE